MRGFFAAAVALALLAPSAAVAEPRLEDYTGFWCQSGNDCRAFADGEDKPCVEVRPDMVLGYDWECEVGPLTAAGPGEVSGTLACRNETSAIQAPPMRFPLGAAGALTMTMGGRTARYASCAAAQPQSAQPLVRPEVPAEYLGDWTRSTKARPRCPRPGRPLPDDDDLLRVTTTGVSTFAGGECAFEKITPQSDGSNEAAVVALTCGGSEGEPATKIEEHWTFLNVGGARLFSRTDLSTRRTIIERRCR